MAATQGTAARLIEVAKAEIGTVEGPKDNQTKYGAFTKVNFQPWCGSFVNWCANQAGVKVPNTVYTPAGAAGFKSAKAWFDNDGKNKPQAGDIIYFDFPGDGVDRISHVGIVVKDNKDGTCTTIEGNTAGNEKGDQRNGGMVALKVRAYDKKNKRRLLVGVVGWGRPDFGKSAANPVKPKPEPVPVTDPHKYPGDPIEPGEKHIHVKTIQEIMGVPKPDGIYGPVTKKAVVAWQKAHPQFGKADGIIGPKTWAAMMKEAKKKQKGTSMAIEIPHFEDPKEKVLWLRAKMLELSQSHENPAIEADRQSLGPIYMAALEEAGLKDWVAPEADRMPENLEDPLASA